MRELMFVVVGACLLLANIWYVQSLRQALSTHRIPNTISPIQFVGIEDAGSIKGRAMASMLAARISAKQNELKTAQQALKLSTLGVPVPNQTTEQRLTPLEFKPRLIEVPDVTLQVSGVDLSGVFAWLVRGLNESRSIQVTVHCPGDSTSYTATADLATQNVPNIWLANLDKDDAKVVDEMAMEILWLYVRQSESIPEAAGLSRKEFEGFVSVMGEVATLNERILRRTSPKPDELQGILTKIETVLERTPDWHVLLKLAAQTAELSGDIGKSILYFRRALDTLPLQSDERIPLAQKIELLSKVLAPAIPQVPAAPSATPQSLVRAWPLSSIAIPSSPVAAKRKVRVAIAGGRPTAVQLRELKIDTESAGDGTSDFSDHAGKLAFLVRSVAPDAELLFADMPGNGQLASTFDIHRNMDSLLELAPDVMLIAWSIPDVDREAMSLALKKFRDQNVIAVLAAGNSDVENQPLQRTIINPDFADVAMVVGAVTPTGLASKYSLGLENPKLFWAPGELIPIPAPRKGTWGTITMNGTSFSAALAAGFVALLLEQVEETPPMGDSIFEAIRATSVRLNPDGPPVLQYQPALQKLLP